MKHQVALNAYEVDVFSIAESGKSLATQPKNGGPGGQRTQAKIEIFLKKIVKKLNGSKNSPKLDFDFEMPDPHPMDFTRCLHKSDRTCVAYPAKT